MNYLKRNNVKKYIFSFIIMLLIIIMYIKFLNQPVSVKNLIKTEKIEYLIPIKTIYFEDFNFPNITCTGLTYDNKDNAFWIVDYGAINSTEIPKPQLIEINLEMNKIIKIIPLDNIDDDKPNLQGITYNISNDSLFVASGKHIYNIDKNGEIIKKININKYEKYLTNGVAYNNISNDLWTLLYSKYLLQCDSNGNINKKIKMNYKDQDQIFIDEKNNYLYISIGADYLGNDNYLLEYDLYNEKVNKLYRVDESYAIEGISIVNGKLYVVNDGLYHSAKIKKSYINIYDLNK